MAIISISKLLLIVGGLFILVFTHSSRPNYAETQQKLPYFVTPYAVLSALLVFSISLLWTSAGNQEALGALAKYGKLLIIPLLILLIHTRHEAVFAVTVFVASQAFLLASSWFLYWGVPLWWATSIMSKTHYAVFSSYLDQGIMAAVLASVCWHFKHLVQKKHGYSVMVFVAVVATLNALFVLVGRSGHAVAIVLLSVAIMWELPKKIRPLVLLLPFVIAFLLFFVSGAVQQRMTLVVAEVQNHSYDAPTTTSTGTRLNLWEAALTIMSQHPLKGSGVGSWTPEYNILKSARNSAHVPIASNGNPHQEYLMWGVQLGYVGIFLLLAFFAAIWSDSRKLPKPYCRAAQSVLLALVVACFFNATLYDAYIGDFFCVTLGLLMALGRCSILESAVDNNNQPEFRIATTHAL